MSGSYLIDLGQVLHFWSMQYSQRQTDHLHILAASGCTDIPRLRSDIVDDGLLQPGNKKVCAFIDDAFSHTSNAVEDDCASSTFYIVHGCLADGDSDEDGDSPS